jgi:hypothetical protein
VNLKTRIDLKTLLKNTPNASSIRPSMSRLAFAQSTFLITGSPNNKAEACPLMFKLPDFYHVIAQLRLYLYNLYSQVPVQPVTPLAQVLWVREQRGVNLTAIFLHSPIDWEQPCFLRHMEGMIVR